MLILLRKKLNIYARRLKHIIFTPPPTKKKEHKKPQQKQTRDILIK